MSPAGARPPIDPDSAEAAFSEAVQRLARQTQSRAALVGKLLKKGFSKAAAEAAVDRIMAAGYLNDAQYAQELVQRRQGSRGVALIARELQAKGVGEDLVAAAIAGVDREAEVRQAKRLAWAALQRRQPANHRQLVQVVGPMLDRRGFSAAVIRQVLDEVSRKWRTPEESDTASDDL